MLLAFTLFSLFVASVNCFNLQKNLAAIKLRPVYANPINADGSNYRSGITEGEAFEWFDEATIYVRGGSGGSGSNTFRFGRSRQHLGLSQFQLAILQ